MEKKWQDITVMTSENIHLFPSDYQDFFAQIQEKTVNGVFPKKKSARAKQNREKYEEQIRRYVLEALNTKPGATVREILELTLPKLPRNVSPAYLTDLVYCAEALLSAQEVAI